MSNIVEFIISVIHYLILCVANYKLLEKAREAGWKGLVPFYRTYCIFKIAWSADVFWIYLGSGVLTGIFAYLLNIINPMSIFYTVVLVLTLLSGLVAVIVMVMNSIRLSKAFSKSKGFMWGLVLLPTVFYLILAFDKSKYIGPQD